MSLEGRIRDLGLHEVCQLLALSRKSGTLEIDAPLQGVRAAIDLAHGMVTGAATWAQTGAQRSSAERPAPAGRVIEECVLELLTWTDGHFRFVAADPATMGVPACRIPLEPLLVEAAQRAEVWERIGDRLPHAGVVPAFVDVDATQLPLLRLVPQEWEVLTRVDGTRTLTELAAVLARDLLDVAGIVHGLIGAGLLTLRDDATHPARRHPTPPAGAAMHDPDLWVPDDDPHMRGGERGGDVLADVFDPVHAGVTSAAGLPRLRTPLAARIVTTWDDVTASAHVPAHEVPEVPASTVASPVDEPSLERGADAPSQHDASATSLCQIGDDAARRGDLATALSCWSAALRSDRQPAPGDGALNADRVREAIALAARLHALLHPS